METLLFYGSFAIILIILILESVESDKRKKHIFHLINNKSIVTEKDLEIIKDMDFLKKNYEWAIIYIYDNSFIDFYSDKPGYSGFSLRIKKDLLYHSQSYLLDKILLDRKSVLKLRIVSPTIFKKSGVETISDSLAIQVIRIR